MPARRPSAARGGEEQAASWSPDGETGEPAVAQFWDGLGFHVDFTNPKGRHWWADGIRNALLDYGVASVWNDNNEYEIWDEDAICDGDGRPFPQALARPAQALLMTKLAYETQAARTPGKRPYAITRGGCAGIAPLRPDLVAATTRPPGRRCATI